MRTNGMKITFCKGEILEHQTNRRENRRGCNIHRQYKYEGFGRPCSLFGATLRYSCLSSEACSKKTAAETFPETGTRVHTAGLTQDN